MERLRRLVNISDFDYELPSELIAHAPPQHRGDSRLMIIDPASGQIHHHMFNEIVKLLNEKCVLVFNNTKVIRARLRGTKPTGAAIECMLTEPLGNHEWLAMLKPAKRLKNGDLIQIGPGFDVEVCEKNMVDGLHRVKLHHESPMNAIHEHGEIPLPPYISPDCHPNELEDRYQSIMAKEDGAVAAPTASLHFTTELLEKLIQNGVQIEEVTLHVGLGTFAPLQDHHVKSKTLHHEQYHISQEVADRLTRAKASGKHIIAVGTTVTRTLESAFSKNAFQSGTHRTNIFIQPGDPFHAIDGLITNFHLPKSTLLMLVSAITERKYMLSCYQHAIDYDYRFFSFGDAMLIL